MLRAAVVMLVAIGCGSSHAQAPALSNTYDPSTVAPPDAQPAAAAEACSFETSGPCCCQLPPRSKDPVRWGLTCACERDHGVCVGDASCSGP